MFRRFFKKKIALGPWFRTPLKMLASMKGLRGGPLDIFGRSRHRRMERALIGWYRDLISQVLNQNHPRALEIAALPEQIRGYEQIKEASVAQAKKRAGEMLAQLPQESTLVNT